MKRDTNFLLMRLLKTQSNDFIGYTIYFIQSVINTVNELYHYIPQTKAMFAASGWLDYVNVLSNMH